MNLFRKFTHSIRAGVIIDNYKDIIKPHHKVIDIGCDTGYMAKKIGDKLFCKIECADIVNNLEYDMPFYLIKDFKMDIPDKKFDIAMINGVLHHVGLNDQLKLIKEVERISKEIVIFEDQFNFVVGIMDALNKLEGMPCPLAHRNLQDWRRLLKDFDYIPVRKPLYYPVRNYIFVKKQA
jgi:ubiquinone/menaquinone biosynthesis C-methylase UbiE